MTTTSASSSQSARLKGKQEPSAKVTPCYEESDGADAGKILRAGGLKLDPWQADVLTDWLAVDENKKWVCRTCAGSVPRQNGKTALLQGRAAAGMILYNEQVIYTAHLQKTATETFEEMAAFFETEKLKKYVKEIKTALGREQIVLKKGARIKFLARTRNGGRGQHGDLLIFDEAQELSIDAQASFIPAVSASQNPQIVYTGTPPDAAADGVVFRGIRDRALAGETENTAWFEFSVPTVGDVKDKTRWAIANPALGRRILLSTIEGEVEQMPPETFARERLGWWTPIVEKKEETAIPAETWDACRSTAVKPEGKTAYGIKFTADGSEVCLSGAVVTPDGNSRISLIEQCSTARGTQWLAEWLNARYNQAACVVIDGRNGVDVLVEKIADTWRLKGSVIRPTARDVIAATGGLCNELNEKTVSWFYMQDALRDSAVTSTRRHIAGGWGFGGENSAPIESAALALWGARTSKRDPNRRMRIG